MDLDRARAPAAARARDDAMGGRVDSRDVHRAVSTNEIDATNYSSRVGCARASGRGVSTTRARDRDGRDDVAEGTKWSGCDVG